MTDTQWTDELRDLVSEYICDPSVKKTPQILKELRSKNILEIKAFLLPYVQLKKRKLEEMSQSINTSKALLDNNFPS